MITKEETKCRLNDLGMVDYDRAYGLQKQYVEELLNGGPQTLLLCEHPAVLTLGRLSNEANILASREELGRERIDARYIDRGGDVTLHAPGQLVVYPIFDLAHFGKDLRRYLHQLEQVAIDLLGDFDIVANRFPGQIGVWVQEKKIASVGIGVRKWISFHGLAVNVTTDLNLFSMIKPCGLNVEMTSMSQIRGKVMDMKKVKTRMVDHFCEHFQLDFMKS